MSTNVVFKIACAEFVAHFCINFGFWSWSHRSIVPFWFDCQQITWLARPTFIPRGAGSIPTGGIFLFVLWPEINPRVHTFWKTVRHGYLTHMRGYHVGLAFRSARFHSQGVIIFLFKWFGTPLRCAFFNHWVDTPDTAERRGCFRWDLFWTPNKKKQLFQ